MENNILISGYVSLDRIINIDTPTKEGLTSIITNHDNDQIYIGGCSINIAAALAKLHVRIKPMVRVGKDYETSGLKAFLEKNEVITDSVEIVSEALTSKSYLVEDVDGNHNTLFYQGAQDREFFRPLKDKEFDGSNYGILTVGNELDNIEFFEKCKKHQIPLIFGMKADFDAFPKNILKDILLYSSIIFTNEAERKEIEKRMNLESITQLHQLGNVETIITTYGGNGSEYVQFTDDKVIYERIPICSPEKVVDFTGCGDAYLAGFLYGYLNGKSTQECCMFGSVLSSFVIEKRGCCTNFPTEETLQKRYDRMRKELK